MTRYHGGPIKEHGIIWMNSTQKLDLPATPKLTQGDLLILIGLVTKEWAEIKKHPKREAYYQTLTRLRQALYAADTIDR